MPRTALEREGVARRGGEHQISSFLDVTTLIIDPVKEHLCSFGVFLASDRLIFSNESDRCQLASERKRRDLKSRGKLSRSDIFRRPRCEMSICEFLPRG